MKRVQLETDGAVCLFWLFRPFSLTEWSARGTRHLAWVESRSGHLLDLFSVVQISNPGLPPFI